MNRRIARSWLLRGAATAAAVALVTGSVVTSASAAAPVQAHPSGNVVNPYSPAYGHPYRHGVVPTIARYRQMQAYTQQHPAPATIRTTTGPETLAYGGGIDGIGVTSGTPKIYLVFWGSQWGTQSTDANGNLTFSNDPRTGAPYIQNLFKGLGTSNELWSGVMTQYCDGSSVATGATSCPAGAPHIGYPTGGALAGVWYDNSAAEPSAATGHQIAVEAVNAAAHFGNTTAASNRYAQYDILSPTGLNPDNYQTQGFCAWHDYNGDTTLTGGAASSSYGDIAFSNMPYVMDAGTGCGQGFVNSPGYDDGYSIVNGHEYAETVTDQNPAGGWTNQTTSTYAGQENGDECAWLSSGQGASANVAMATGTFAMQSTWSNDTNRCDISHAIVGGSSGGNDFSISATPSSQSVTQGGSTTYTVNTAVTSGSAQSISLSASGLGSGATASFSPTSVTAGSSSTLTISTTSTAATGTVTVTITGTATSGTHSTTVSFTVNPPATNDFSISANPTSLSITQGSSGGSTISTAVTSGTAGTVSLSASVSPSGPTASLGASSVTAGNSTSLTVNVGSTVATGSYTVTVTGTEGTATHSTTVSVSVTSSGGGGGGITNGGFETGSFSGWTTSGASATISTTAHSGSYSAMLGKTVATNGDSAVAQTFTVPSGYGTLSFWYQVHCPDTVTYDWATATLKDNTAGTTATMLAHTCVSSSPWTQVSANVTAGHSYTLTLVSHDDNYGSDPTYTLYDDAALGAAAPPPPAGITNGGFETGSLSGWTSSGAATSVSTTAHSGSYSAILGKTTATNGDSAISQSFSAPTGTSKLTFWYQIHCPDTLTYDWATVTLKDNTAGTTTTVLAKTCVTSSPWTQVSASVTAGHSYTLTLVSHDDNYSSDPTYTLYDDVALQ